MTELQMIRKQLKQAIQFANSTPTHDPLWWAGEVPAYPDEYVSEEWQEENKPFWQVWEEYLEELTAEANRTELPELYEHLEKAGRLPIQDLLSESRLCWKGAGMDKRLAYQWGSVTQLNRRM